jgi:hypothetical protein
MFLSHSFLLASGHWTLQNGLKRTAMCFKLRMTKVSVTSASFVGDCGI